MVPHVFAFFDPPGFELVLMNPACEDVGLGRVPVELFLERQNGRSSRN